MDKKKWKRYLEIPASEQMDSSSQAALIDNAIVHIPHDAHEIICVGCGDGYELFRIKNLPWVKRVVGTNLNPKQTEYVKRRRLECYCADMHDLPFEDNSFDLCFLRDVFEHALSPYIAMSELARVSRKYVLIVLPDESWQFSKWHYIIPTKVQIVSLALKCGLLLRKEWQFSYQSGYLFQHGNVPQGDTQTLYRLYLSGKLELK